MDHQNDDLQYVNTRETFQPENLNQPPDTLVDKESPRLEDPREIDLEKVKNNEETVEVQTQEDIKEEPDKEKPVLEENESLQNEEQRSNESVNEEIPITTEKAVIEDNIQEDFDLEKTTATSDNDTQTEENVHFITIRTADDEDDFKKNKSLNLKLMLKNSFRGKFDRRSREASPNVEGKSFSETSDGFEPSSSEIENVASQSDDDDVELRKFRFSSFKQALRSSFKLRADEKLHVGSTLKFEEYKSDMINKKQKDETETNDETKVQSSENVEIDEGVELRRSKRMNLRLVLTKSFNGRLWKSPTTKTARSSESELMVSSNTRRIRELETTLMQYQQTLSKLMPLPPAPLLVEDPPSSDERGDEHVKNQSLLNGSSGNFGSAGPRSAPTTPQGLLLGAPPAGAPEPPASPSIQRSPSHSVFTKIDKTSLKHLSTSTPVMTAQGQLNEPPSPKAAKDPKVYTASKGRQKKFLRHFPNVEDDEKVLNHYSCALIGDILLQGHLYITKNYFAFYSNVFGYVTKLLIPILTVEDITKEKTARIIPNAIGVLTGDDKHIFGSLMSRDSTLAYMRTVWEKAKSEEIIPEPEIDPEDQDSSESGESGRDSPTLEVVSPSPKFALMRKVETDGRGQSDISGSSLERKGSRGFFRTLKEAIAEFRKLPRQNLILVATTLLLILLFLSAAVLLYRINKIQNRFSWSLQDNSLIDGTEDIYSDLLQWQAQLHSKSADAVNSLLESNLDQISKVRQSLEALSMLLMQNELAENNKDAKGKEETTSTENMAKS